MLHREEVLKEARSPLKNLIENVHEEVRRTAAELRIGLATGSIPGKDAPARDVPTAGQDEVVRSQSGTMSAAASSAAEGVHKQAPGEDSYAVVIPANMPPTAGRIVWS